MFIIYVIITLIFLLLLFLHTGLEFNMLQDEVYD